MKNEPYTNFERAYIKLTYGRIPYTHIARRLCRNPEGVRAVANKMGLKVSRKDCAYVRGRSFNKGRSRKPKPTQRIDSREAWRQNPGSFRPEPERSLEECFARSIVRVDIQSGTVLEWNPEREVAGGASTR